MDFFFAVGLVVAIALSLLVIAVNEALLKQYEASLKEIDEELYALKKIFEQRCRNSEKTVDKKD